MNEIFTRRSVRKFLPTMVEDEKIELLLRAGMAAPSMGNQQPWEFYVVRDKRVIPWETNSLGNFTSFVING